MKGRGPHLLVILTFVGVLLSAGGFQLGLELRQGETPRVLQLLTRTPTVPHLRAYEQTLEETNWIATHLRPWIQYVRFILFRDLGPKALVGLESWCFYLPGVQYPDAAPFSIARFRSRGGHLRLSGSVGCSRHSSRRHAGT